VLANAPEEAERLVLRARGNELQAMQSFYDSSNSVGKAIVAGIVNSAAVRESVYSRTQQVEEAYEIGNLGVALSAMFENSEGN
jgi:hypothetical protein